MPTPRTFLKVSAYALAVGLLAALIVPSLLCNVDGCTPTGPGSRHASTKPDMLAIGSALSAYKQDTGTYPSTRQGLDALVHCPVGVRGWKGYFREVPLDPWGNPYHYTAPAPGGNLYELRSDGSDGRPGGEDETAAVDVVMRYPEDFR